MNGDREVGSETVMEKENSVPCFSALELAKICRVIADSMQKIQVVIERLEKAGDVKNALLLTQAFQNLNKLEARLSNLGVEKTKHEIKRTLERAKKVLDEKPGG